MLSLSDAKAAIEAEVREVSYLEPAERKKRIRQLQLRWHPGATQTLKVFNPKSGGPTQLQAGP